MGTNLFKKGPPAINPGGAGIESRALSAGSYAGRAAGGNANKDIANALALYRSHGMKPAQRSAAYPPGPKKV